MKRITFILLLTLIKGFAFSQVSETDACIDLLKEDRENLSEPKVRNILTDGSSWVLVAFYEVLKDTTIFLVKPTQFRVQKKKLIYSNSFFERINLKKGNAFETVAGGRGPERSTKTIKYFDGNCLILASTIAVKGYFNGKLKHYDEKSIRYLYRRVD